ncbi:MAG: hypothetical protein ACR2QO_25605 [Acidimicrobiales bacterium]
MTIRVDALRSKLSAGRDTQEGASAEGRIREVAISVAVSLSIGESTSRAPVGRQSIGTHCSTSWARQHDPGGKCAARQPAEVVGPRLRTVGEPVPVGPSGCGILRSAEEKGAEVQDALASLQGRLERAESVAVAMEDAKRRADRLFKLTVGLVGVSIVLLVLSRQNRAA